MPKWIKCSDRLPSEEASYFVIGKMGRGSIPFKDGVWGKDHPHMRVFEYIIEWLDEEDNTPSFNIKDMEASYEAGMENERASWSSHFDEFMKEKYNIET